MGKSKKKFHKIWKNQSQLGDCGCKLLIKVGLKDAETKEATRKAIEEGYAISTPLRDGTPFFMWNREKIEPLLNDKHPKLSLLDYWTIGFLTSSQR